MLNETGFISKDSNLGFFYTVFNERRAVEFSVEQLRKVYPSAPIFLVSDGGIDFSYLKLRFNNICTKLEIDTMSKTFEINKENYIQGQYQEVIRNCVKTLLCRLEEAIEYLGTDYICMLDPDALVRGKLSIPNNALLLGSRVNKGFPRKFRKIIRRVHGSIDLNTWGATPGIFHAKTFLEAKEFLCNNWQIFEELNKEFHALYAHDVILPVMFSLIGIEETFNPDITECLRDTTWKYNSKPLVHQFREFYFQ